MLSRQEEIVCTVDEVVKDIRNFVNHRSEKLKKLKKYADKKAFLTSFSYLKRIFEKILLLQTQLETLTKNKNGDVNTSDYALINSLISACVITGLKKEDIKNIAKLRDYVLKEMLPVIKKQKFNEKELKSLERRIDENALLAFLNFTAISQEKIYDTYLEAWKNFQNLDQALIDSLRIIEEVESGVYFKQDVLAKLKLLELNRKELQSNKTEIRNCSEQKVILENTYKQLVEIKKESAKKLIAFDCSPQTLHKVMNKLNKTMEGLKKTHHPSVTLLMKRLANVIQKYMGKSEESISYMGKDISIAA